MTATIRFAGQRSRSINHALRNFVDDSSTEALRALLEQTVVRDRDLDAEVAAEWFAVDKPAWRPSDESKRRSTRP